MAKIRGKWEWKIAFEAFQLNPMYDGSYECNFISNNKSFTRISFSNGTGNTNISYDGLEIHWWTYDMEAGETNYHWDERYLIMDFGAVEQEIDDVLYEVIVANARMDMVAEKLLIVAEKIPKVYDAGKQAEYDAFWNMIQDNGNRTDYGQAFRNWRSSTEHLRPKYKVVPTASTSAMNTFYNCEGLKKVEAEYFDFSKKARGGYQGSGWYHTFTTCGELEEIEDIGIMPDTDLTNTFAHCPNLKKVAMIRVDVNTVISSGIFEGCKSLESVTFDGEIGYGTSLKWSTKLNRASIENIITHLSDKVSGKTLTLSKTAVDEAFEFVTEVLGETPIVKGSDTEAWHSLIADAVDAGWTITLA